MKLILVVSLPLLLRLAVLAQPPRPEKPGFAEKIGLPNQPLANFKPVTGAERFKWFVKSTVGPRSLFLTGPMSAALSTATDSPSEYGPHWDGLPSAMACG